MPHQHSPTALTTGGPTAVSLEIKITHCIGRKEYARGLNLLNDQFRKEPKSETSSDLAEKKVLFLVLGNRDKEAVAYAKTLLSKQFSAYQLATIAYTLTAPKIKEDRENISETPATPACKAMGMQFAQKSLAQGGGKGKNCVSTLASVYQNNQEYAKALKLIEHFLVGQKDQQIPFFLQRFELLVLLKKEAEANALADKYAENNIKNEGNNPSVKIIFAITDLESLFYRRKKQIYSDTAIKFGQKYCLENPKNETAISMLINAYATAHKNQEALVFINSVITKSPELEGKLAFQKISILLTMDQEKEAIAYVNNFAPRAKTTEAIASCARVLMRPREKQNLRSIPTERVNIAFSLAQKAKLQGDASPYLENALACGHFIKGDKKKAIAMQTTLIHNIETGNVDKESRGHLWILKRFSILEFKKQLAEFKKG
jgi:Tetratrico peptide repeat